MDCAAPAAKSTTKYFSWWLGMANSCKAEQLLQSASMFYLSNNGRRILVRATQQSINSLRCGGHCSSFHGKAKQLTRNRAASGRFHLQTDVVERAIMDSRHVPAVNSWKTCGTSSFQKFKRHVPANAQEGGGVAVDDFARQRHIGSFQFVDRQLRLHGQTDRGSICIQSH